jgi:hypothetical protein
MPNATRYHQLSRQSIEKVLAAAKTDQAKTRAEELKQKAAARVSELQTQLDTVEANAKSKLDAAAAAQDAAKAAEARQADAAKAAREAKLVLEPVSVFISRTTQRLYVRHGFEATLEVPVTIRDQDKPIGTHVFTAVARTDRGPLDRGHDRQRGQRPGRARPHQHPARCARSHRAHRIAAILAHHLGRAAEPRD